MNPIATARVTKAEHQEALEAMWTRHLEGACEQGDRIKDARFPRVVLL